MKSKKIRENRGKLCMYYQWSVAHTGHHTHSALLVRDIMPSKSESATDYLTSMAGKCDKTSGHNFAVLQPT